MSISDANKDHAALGITFASADGRTATVGLSGQWSEQSVAPAKVWDLSSSDRDPEWREVLTAETTDVTFSREDVRFVEVGNTTYTLIGLTADTSRLYRTEDGIAWVTALEISTSARIRHVWTTNGVALWYDGRRSELSGGVVPGSVTASVLDSPDFPANSITAMQAHCDASR